MVNDNINKEEKDKINEKENKEKENRNEKKDKR